MAKHAIFSDVHGNWEALVAVYRDLAPRDDLRDVWSLGDLVGYGPDPNKVIGGLHGLTKKGYQVHYCMGNHDGAAIGRFEFMDIRNHDDRERLAQEAGLETLEAIAKHYHDIEHRKYVPVRTNAKLSNDWTAAELTDASKQFIAARSKDHGLLADGVLCVHGSPRDPLFEYITNAKRAQRCLEAPLMSGIHLCFLGHSHMAKAWQWGADDVVTMFGKTVVMNPPTETDGGTLDVDPDSTVTIVNVGSVGQPRDGDPRACFAIYDDQAATVELRRAEYDVAATRQKIHDSALPNVLADRLGRADAKGGVEEEQEAEEEDES